VEPNASRRFNQAFRSIIPESVGGAESGAKFETFGISLEKKLPSRTYLGVSGEILKSTLTELWESSNTLVRPTLQWYRARANAGL